MALTAKNLPAMQETWVRSLGQEDPLQEKWQPTPVFLPGEFHGLRGLAGYSPYGHKESDTTEQRTHTHTGITCSHTQELLEKKRALEQVIDSLATEHSKSNGSRIQRASCHLRITTLAMKGTHLL